MESENFKIVSVTRDRIILEILDSTQFTGQFAIGSYIKIPYLDKSEEFVVGVINNYKIKNIDSTVAESKASAPIFLLEVDLIGSYKKEDGKFSFERGAHGIPLPPCNGIELLSDADYNNIFNCKIKDGEAFTFAKLVQKDKIRVPVNGNRFFNKHFAIVGSTSSGKSHTVATLLQAAIKGRKSGFKGLNNSHIVLFDIHGEYAQAFPEANQLNSANLKIPYWLFDSEELRDLFIESNEVNSHNQVSQFQFAVTQNKKRHDLKNPEKLRIPQDRIYFDSPIRFEIDEVIQYIKNMNKEVIGKLEGEGVPKKANGHLINDRISCYFDEDIQFWTSSTSKESKASNGPFNGDFERFILRLETIRNNPRLRFLFGASEDISLESVLQQLIGYTEEKSNITVIDLSGIPFEVLSITVSLISRLLFEYGFYYMRLMQQGMSSETPLLLLYEEAHKYVPKSELARYRTSRNAIERIAKEGRKYGVTLGIVSQRPSEISETIFSQCNNFIAMRLTNPEDQNYVKRLLPDNMGDLTSFLPSLQSGEAIVIGDSIILPSLVKIDFPDKEPKSADILYWNIWQEKWKEAQFESLTKEWKK